MAPSLDKSSMTTYTRYTDGKVSPSSSILYTSASSSFLPPFLRSDRSKKMSIFFSLITFRYHLLCKWGLVAESLNVAWLAKKHINKTFDNAVKIGDLNGDEAITKDEVLLLLLPFFASSFLSNSFPSPPPPSFADSPSLSHTRLSLSFCFRYYSYIFVFLIIIDSQSLMLCLLQYHFERFSFYITMYSMWK